MCIYLYDFEKRQSPHPLSPEALNFVAQRLVIVFGQDYAGAFMLIRPFV